MTVSKTADGSSILSSPANAARWCCVFLFATDRLAIREKRSLAEEMVVGFGKGLDEGAKFRN